MSLAQSHNSDTTMNTTLDEVVVERTVRGNYLNGSAVDKREIISTVGLRKMACCTLAESFENSATVSVDYSDAVSGTRQIKMLGLSGTYTQFLDESRPTMRGLVAPYSLNYTPGDWLKSIQVSKGVASVTAGHEAITGQINLEYRKPTDDERLHINFYLDDMLRPELNLTSAIPLKRDGSLSTIIMAHGSIDTDWRKMSVMDRNKDGFRDLPSTRQVDVANRWFWLLPNGVQLRWGGRFTAERRLGGQLHYHGDRSEIDEAWGTTGPSSFQPIKVPSIYGSEVVNHDAGAYFKMGIPLRHIVTDVDGNEAQDNIALIADYNHFDTKSYFGFNHYNAHENSVSLNLRLDHHFASNSSLAVGLQGRLSYVRETLLNRVIATDKDDPTKISGWGSFCPPEDRMDESEVGAYVEWTFRPVKQLTLIGGVRGDYNGWSKEWMLTPRAHLKWDITTRTALRASAGMGHRTPRAIIENLGMLATGYLIRTGNLAIPYTTQDIEKAIADRDYHQMEKALTVGGSLTQTFALGRDQNASLSADFFHTHFYRSLIATQEPWQNAILLYSSTGSNYTNTWQVDFNWTPIERLDLLATFRYTQSRMEIPTLNLVADLTGRVTYQISDKTQLVDRPLMSRFKGLINLSYATRFRIWVFDVTAQLNGPVRVPRLGQNKDSWHSPTYAQLFAQVTHKIGKADIYVGCENITDYRQKDVITAADRPYSSDFNSMNVWGPLMGRKFYIGLRWNLY